MCKCSLPMPGLQKACPTITWDLNMGNVDVLQVWSTSTYRLPTFHSKFLFEYSNVSNTCYRPKYAVTAVKKKLYSSNPHQAMFALLTLESIVKNCGKQAYLFTTLILIYIN